MNTSTYAADEDAKIRNDIGSSYLPTLEALFVSWKLPHIIDFLGDVYRLFHIYASQTKTDSNSPSLSMSAEAIGPKRSNYSCTVCYGITLALSYEIILQIQLPVS